MTLERRHLWYALAIAGFAAIVVALLRPEVVDVEVGDVRTGPLQVTVGDEGQARVRHRHVLTAPVAGRLERLDLEVGDTVRPGAVVARIAPLPLDPRHQEQATAALAAARDRAAVARAAVAQVITALEQAGRDRERAAALARGGAIGAAELERLERVEDSRERELEGAQALARAADHDVDAARAVLQADGVPTRLLELTCPIGGRVLTVPEESARTVQPGEVLLEVGDPDQLEIVVDLLSSDAVRVAPGQRMILTGWGGDTVLAGVVRRVDPAGFTKVSALGVEEQRVNVTGDFVTPSGRLGDGFRLQVQVVLWQADSVLTVPGSALFRHDAGWAVFVVEDGRAHLRLVTIGHESSSDSEVLSGLRAGEIVIRHPSDRVRDGARVRAVR